jgi:two-component system response regulator DesR
MTRGTRIRVLIADDNAEVRSALAALVDSDAELQLAATAGDATQAVELAARNHPDVALVDMRMPAGGGVAAVRGMAARSPRTRVVLLSAYGTVPEGLETNVAGCIAKGSSIDHIVHSVKRAAEDQPARLEPSN